MGLGRGLRFQHTPPPPPPPPPQGIAAWHASNNHFRQSGKKTGNIRVKPLDFRASNFRPPPPPPPRTKLVPYALADLCGFSWKKTLRGGISQFHTMEGNPHPTPPSWGRGHIRWLWRVVVSVHYRYKLSIFMKMVSEIKLSFLRPAQNQVHLIKLPTADISWSFSSNHHTTTYNMCLCCGHTFTKTLLL